jgi:hypothetical protein
MKKSGLWTIASMSVLALGLNQAQAQTPELSYPQNYQAARSGLNGKPRSGFLFSPFGAGVRPLRLAPLRIRLMTAGSASDNIDTIHNRSGLSTLVAGPSLPVVGGGTVGRLTKWTGITSSNSLIGDSTIFETKLGLVGIGTETPTSRLTVAGTIQSLTGGFQFPDGTIQTTAGIAPGQVVRSLNGLIGDLTLVPGPNVSITPGANSLIIDATGLLSGVSHDTTLLGNGTLDSPLGVAVPLSLTNATGSIVPVLELDNPSGLGLRVIAGNAAGGVSSIGGDSNAVGGSGVHSQGGIGDVGGPGVTSFGGGGSAAAGNGVNAIGGSSANGTGGNGITATAGSGGAGDGLAGRFNGDVEITGNLSKGGGSFKIDHPLDPENKYLYHSFVESPDMKNIYDGNVALDKNGEAVVRLPAWFQALNRDFRYSLTAIGVPGPNLFIAEEVDDNRFKIAGGTPGMKVSWQVTGIRQDPYANKNRIKIEEQKSELERGFYLHPESYGLPEEKRIGWTQSLNFMRQAQEAREQVRRRNVQQ